MKKSTTSTTKKQKRPSASKKRSRVSKQSSLREIIFESDGTYILKLVVYMLLGALWIRFEQPLVWGSVPLAAFPLGAVLALLAVRYLERHQLDRKLLYIAVVFIALVSNFEAAGFVL